MSLSNILEWSRRINLNALRSLSLSLLFSAILPIASIWVLFCSWLFQGSEELLEPNSGAGLPNDSDDASSSALVDAMNNPNATLQEILTLVLVERYGTFGFRGARTSAYHWFAVIPWVLSLILGFVVPLVLYLLSWMRTRRNQQEKNANYAEYRRKTPTKKDPRCPGRLQMELREEDRDHDESADSWKMPHPGCPYSVRVENNKCAVGWGTRSVPGLCAICLDKYECGHKVVWSQTSSCCHTFHLDCLLGWFSARRRRRHLCPCCRQIYFVKPSR